ncbi:acylphosphatase [Aeromicrobium sp.]|uniref:acylphosphatase n=1 Tax=Aeromicrobium sp. TaxID=1871063 RepID=UPI0028AE40F9|nr:acylphosphatase [Aeromicrobium sp.]
MTVRGRVQGVGYRDSMRVVAERAGVGGWVRNRPAGTVEAELEGPSEQVDQVLAWMAQGPPGASVDGTDVTEASPTGTRGFEVR